jgi:hypothetical protein
MLRSLSLFGIACLALAACALVKPTARQRQPLPTDQNSSDDKNCRWDSVRLLANGFHARFSLN